MTALLILGAMAFALLSGINYYIHDGNVSAMSEHATTDAPAAQPPVERSMWRQVSSTLSCTT